MDFCPTVSTQQHGRASGSAARTSLGGAEHSNDSFKPGHGWTAGQPLLDADRRGVLVQVQDSSRLPIDAPHTLNESCALNPGRRAGPLRSVAGQSLTRSTQTHARRNVFRHAAPRLPGGYPCGVPAVAGTATIGYPPPHPSVFPCAPRVSAVLAEERQRARGSGRHH